MEALSGQYKSALGKPKDFRFLSDKSQETLTKLGVNPDQWDDVSTGSAETKYGARPKTEQATSFNSLEDAEAAGLPKGTVITIGGRRAIVE